MVNILYNVWSAINNGVERVASCVLNTSTFLVRARKRKRETERERERDKERKRDEILSVFLATATYDLPWGRL